MDNLSQNLFEQKMQEAAQRQMELRAEQARRDEQSRRENERRADDQRRRDEQRKADQKRIDDRRAQDARQKARMQAQAIEKQVRREEMRDQQKGFAGNFVGEIQQNQSAEFANGSRGPVMTPGTAYDPVREAAATDSAALTDVQKSILAQHGYAVGDGWHEREKQRISDMEAEQVNTAEKREARDGLKDFVEKDKENLENEKTELDDMKDELKSLQNEKVDENENEMQDHKPDEVINETVDDRENESENENEQEQEQEQIKPVEAVTIWEMEDENEIDDQR